MVEQHLEVSDSVEIWLTAGASMSSENNVFLLAGILAGPRLEAVFSSRSTLK